VGREDWRSTGGNQLITVSPGVHIDWMATPKMLFFVELSGHFALPSMPKLYLDYSITDVYTGDEIESYRHSVREKSAHLLLKVGMSFLLNKNKKGAGR
jgi:hypothetical protein